MTEDWTKEWERRVVNGVYPLRRYLGRSNHSVVFLTECKAQNVAEAAIKILPANPTRLETQLAHWRQVATLSHPHLMRLLDAGRCQLGGHNFLFVVTDRAEQNLAQILPGRPLTSEEARDLLPPTLDALAYLHGRNLVHGGLKPTNFLVVGDQLKLSSDTIRPPGERTASTGKLSLYHPPEFKKDRGSTAGDVWGLGITLVEALTQTAPAWSRENSDIVSLPANLAGEYVATIQRCLSRDPGKRPSVTELAAQFNPLSPVTRAATPTPPAAPTPPPAPTPPAAPTAAAMPTRAATATPPALAMPPAAAATPVAVSPVAAPPVAARAPVRAVAEPSVPTASPQAPHRMRSFAIAAAVGIIALLVIWTGAHRFHSHSNAQPTVAMALPVPPAASPPAAVEHPKAGVAAPPAVLHQELPDVSRRARESIHGVIKIGVRVIVDRSGNVVAATLDNRASSRYFARTALEAAKKWTFAKGPDQASRVWLLNFEFTRGGVAARDTALQ